MKINELHNQPVQPDTYEASMAQNQLLKIGTHSVQLHGLIKNDQEMESWIAKKIDLASNYVKSVHGYMAGSKAGAYDDNGMSEGCSKHKVKESQSVRVSTDVEGEWGGALGKLLDRDDDGNVLVGFGKEAHWFKQNDIDFNDEDFGSSADDDDVLDIDFDESQPNAGAERADAARGMWASSKEIQSRFKTWQDFMNSEDFDEWLDDKFRDEMGEDAGEGHMSKSQLYQTAKMAIELIEMIKQGDDLEAWVQTKLNVAADYLQAVYHYEEYQKLNPYREQIDSNTFAKHSEIVKKSIDEILARETKIDDVDTKPGMMRILGKRVNEVEKNIAKDTKEESVKETADKDRAIRFDKAMRSGQYEQFADILSDAMHFASVTNKDFERELQTAKDEFEDQTNEDAAGVGIITKQNTTADVKPGDEYKNVKKLGLKSSAYESKLTDMLKQRLK